ncbi:MAG TPA: helix-hairpin-helix domain-containing protein [Symbiobacteriaceae bacterium]|nr:helix-hairpin-helix domain-containing protein [Symbiobacteriaceae bacterium]
MAEQGLIRYGVLGVVGALIAGLVWLGLVRYQADRRSLQAAAPEPAAAEVAAAAASPAPVAAPVLVAVPEQVVVHVAGAVVSPGVYKLEKGARVGDAIAAAGGALPEGVPDALNLADRLEDGLKISVPTKKELEAAPPPPVAVSGQAAAKPAAAPAKVNVNTGTVAQFDALPNVSPTVAKNIVDYRSKNGPFKKLEDLDKVSGIGPATLEKMRPYLTL